jgi:hypothetical protein
VAGVVLAPAGPFLAAALQQKRMPATLEVRCENGGCEMDMFELHYTYDMPDDVGVADFSCPYCGTTDDLAEIQL